jgi:hypothetical protein
MKEGKGSGECSERWQGESSWGLYDMCAIIDSGFFGAR